MKYKYYRICILLGLVWTGCYYDVEEEIYPSIECQTLDMSYQNDVVPILQDRCYKCHDLATNTANITLEGFNNLKVYVDNGRFLGAIKRESGYSPMPKNEEALLDCQVEKIESWIIDGALNN